MNKRQSTSGHISLYDMHHQFVTSKKYQSLLERSRILDMWKKMYRLEDKLFYINIKPEIKNDL
jgi:hypothetical protein